MGVTKKSAPACPSKHKKHFEGLVEKDGVGEKRGCPLFTMPTLIAQGLGEGSKGLGM